MYPSILHGRIKFQASYSVPGPYSTSRLPVILPAETAFYTAASLHAALPATPRRIPQGIHLVSTKFTRKVQVLHYIVILRSVCSNLLLLALRIILQEKYKEINSIQVSSNSMRRNYILSYIQTLLVIILHKVH